MSREALPGGPGVAPPWPPVRRREVVGWAMFDFANSSYTTVIVTVAFSVYFTRVVAAGPRADWLWSLAVAASNALVVLLAPPLGAVADASGRKKIFLGGTWAVCVAGTAALALVGPGEVALGMATFVVSNVAYSLGESLAGAFLPEISTPATIGRISGFGWGLGYLGGLASLLAVMPLLAGGFTAANRSHLEVAWLVTAAFFGVGALPTFLLLRERAVRPARFDPLNHARAGLARLAVTLRSLHRLSELARFLAVFFAFSCGLTAVIAFSSIFAERTLGFGPGDLVVLFMVLQVSAAAGAVLFGWVQDRVGARLTIQTTLVLWLGVCAGAFFCHSRPLFWGIGLVAGLGLGSAQSASRALVGLLAPAGKEGELFGFWGLAGKAAYALGPLTFGALSAASGSQRLALLSTAAFFLVGLAGMTWVDEARGVAQARAWEGGPHSPPSSC